MNKALAKDLAKERREYLRKKAEGIAIKKLSQLTMCGSGVCFLFALIWTIRFCLSALFAGSGFIHWLNVSKSITCAGAILLILGLAYIVANRIYYSCDDELKSLPYVPPVAEQIAALTQKGLLLRGSDQPTALPGELLRAAQKGSEGASEELLKPEESRTA